MTLTRVLSFITFVLGANALMPELARAQAPAHGSVEGVVYDSVRKQPLAHAIVQLVEAPPGNGAYSAISDSLGHFHLADVRAGQYIAGFLHPLLDSIGVLAPYRSVTVPSAGSVRVELAIPSAVDLTNAICAPTRAARAGKAPPDSTGTLVGHVYDATTGAPMQSSLVAVLWAVLSLDAKGVHRETQQLHAKTNEDGWFAFCGLGAGDYQVRAESGARNTGYIDFTLHPRDIGRISLVLGADSAASAVDSAARGGARLAGTVTTKDGHPLEGAQVVIDGSSASATTDAQGDFSLGGLREGTRMVEARALGYAPARMPVTPSRNEPPTIAIVMEKRVETLQAVTVFGKESGRMRDLTGFAERSRRGFGHFVTRSQIEATDPQSVCDLFRRVPGVTVTAGGAVGFGCGVNIRGVASLSRCEPTVYLDNMKFGGSVSEFANSISPRDVMGIEVYSSATEPVQFPGGCGSIVVWTR